MCQFSSYKYSVVVDDSLKSMSYRKNCAITEAFANGFLNQRIGPREIKPTNEYKQHEWFDKKLEKSLKIKLKNWVGFYYSKSTLAVASSMTRILDFFRIALARHMSCFWPTLKFEPPFWISESRPLPISLTVTFNWTFYVIQKIKTKCMRLKK